MASLPLVTASYGQQTDRCSTVRAYLLRVDEIAITTFAEEREKKLAEAQTEFQNRLRSAQYSLSTELTELISQYVSLTSYGHDRMRKGDTRLLVKAREVEQRIKELCPWD